MSQLKKGAMLSYVTIFLTNVVGLILTPFIISKLGDAEYGLYTLIGAFVGYISVLDLGLNNTIVRFVAKYRAEKNKESEENFLAITMLIYSVISFIVVIVGVVMFYNLETFFSNSLTLGELEKSKTMFVILIFNLAITLPGGGFTAICSGYEHFVYPRTINIIRYVIRSIMVVALLLAGGDAIGLVILDTIMNILVICFNGFYVFRKLKVVFKIHKFDFFLIKEIFSYSIWIFVFALVNQFQWKVGQVVLGSYTNTTIVAIYAIGIMLGTYYGAFSSAIAGVFLPKATKMIVEKATSLELTDMMIKIGRILLLVLLMILGGFILFGKQFVILWLGPNYLESWLIALIIMVVYTIPLVQNFAYLVLEARNKLSFRALINIVFIIIGTFIGVLLIPMYGALGMLLGTSVGWVLSQVIMNFYYNNVIKLKIIYFFKKLFQWILLSFFIIIVLGLIIDQLPGNGWLNLLIKIVIYVLIYINVMYILALNKNEKEIFKSIRRFNKK